MSLSLGALYRNCEPDEVRAIWKARLLRLGEEGLSLQVGREAGGSGPIALQLRARPERRVPHRRLGALVRLALGPEREEEAEFWLLEPAGAEPGALRLAGASWEDCLAAISRPGRRQVRLWSPLVCPAGMRAGLAEQGRSLGLELRAADSWAVLAVPRAKPEPPYPAPWHGNYGW